MFIRFLPTITYEAEGTGGTSPGETTEATGVSTEQVVETTEVSSDTSVDEPKTEPAASPPEPKPVPQDWRERRIAQLTARLREAERTKTEPTAQSEIDQNLIESRAREIAAQQQFNDRCNDVAIAGRKAFADFDQRVSSLTQLVDKTDPASIAGYNQFLMAALETGEAARLIHELGGDLNEASRILALPPVKMAVELAKRAVAKEVDVSRAPKPISPVTGRGGSHEAIAPSDPDRADRLSTAAWMERREAELASKRRRA